MLEKLIIKNVALIESAEIEFTEGLNVLSGETGSGKSVIIESLNFVLGAKADKTLIRNGERECSVSAVFGVNDNEYIYSVYKEFDIEEDDVLIISRKMSVDGKNSVKINGNTVTVGMLKKFTAYLVDVHGQSEHFYLLKNSNQLSLIDKLGGESLAELKKSCENLYAAYKKVLNDLNEIGGDESGRAIRLDILDFQIKEIEKADVKENEEQELVEIRQKLANQEKIISALTAVNRAFSEEGGAIDVLSNAEKMLSGISDYSPEYSELYERLKSAISELDDISETAYGIADDFDYGEYDADFVENRIETIKAIKKKYGTTVEEINAFLINAKEEKYKLENIGEISGKLISERDKLERELYDAYMRLHKKREESAQSLCKDVLSELVELGIKRAQFCVEFNAIPKFEECSFNSPHGFDQVEFMFSANLGEPLKPLSSVISGGEMSRFMLALKVRTSKYNNISTFIFDEIDAGISGAIAKTVAEKFAKIATETQIIAITHLPQISAMADNNLLISKNENAGKTLTVIKHLAADEKVNEIIRLVGGDSDSKSARIHAEDLIKKADEFKTLLKKPI